MTEPNNKTSDLPLPNVLLHQHKVLVVNKPGGLLTQGPPGIDSLELRIKRWRKTQLNPETQNYLGVPHRLDRPASGVMIFATDKPTANKLSRQFEARQIQKTYWALVSGNVQPESGEWTDFMRKMPDQAKSEIVTEESEGAQKAVLDYRLLARSTDQSATDDGRPFSLLEINLQTGRTHQIRLQSGSRGFPILGDEMYGSETKFGPPTSDLRLRWIALHARRIAFMHPNTEQSLEIVADVPACWPELNIDH